MLQPLCSNWCMVVCISCMLGPYRTGHGGDNCCHLYHLSCCCHIMSVHLFSPIPFVRVLCICTVLAQQAVCCVLGTKGDASLLGCHIFTAYFVIGSIAVVLQDCFRQCNSLVTAVLHHLSHPQLGQQAGSVNKYCHVHTVYHACITPQGEMHMHTQLLERKQSTIAQFTNQPCQHCRPSPRQQITWAKFQLTRSPSTLAARCHDESAMRECTMLSQQECMRRQAAQQQAVRTT
jgi:hypothetical protein